LLRGEFDWRDVVDLSVGVAEESDGVVVHEGGFGFTWDGGESVWARSVVGKLSVVTVVSILLHHLTDTPKPSGGLPMTTLVGYVLGVGDDPEVRAGVIQGVIVKMVGFFVGSPARVTGHDEDLPGQENVYLDFRKYKLSYENQARHGIAAALLRATPWRF
jgi:hypothetical protein